MSGRTLADTADLAGRRVLLLNWRDRRHPRAGGAEVYVHEVATRLAAAGAAVTVFTAAHPGAAPEEEDAGVRVVRRGGTFGVYLAAALFLLRNRRRFDVVLDFQNGIPFFASLFASRRTAVVLVVHHVHQDQFLLHFPWPASRVGQVLEGPVSRVVYGRRPVVAVSPSTRHDVRRRLRLRGPIHVVPNGLASPVRDVDRAPDEAPRVVVVSRLVSHKRFHLLVEAVPRLLPRWPGLQVDIAGDGPERAQLQRLVDQRGLGDRVRLHGFVSAAFREELLERAWLTVSPSQNEGWGLTVVEANAAGVPAVAFAVPGLKDSVVDGRTGWLVPPEGDLADGIDRALIHVSDPAAARAVAEECRRWASRFSWDATAERLAAVALGELDRVRHLPRSRRAATDLAARVDLLADPAVPAEDVAATVRARLRRSDQVSVASGAVRLVLPGCDEAGAELVVARLDGCADVAGIGLATPSELLVGAGG
ncbi:glycosyltransferase family 4 protein [Aquipuribacter sp. SD81]|uniref:glycosyltransferase family 4 protein n=1 Tax=Aquipuribacter sp. SD81 TaxID=3127703 RepID=UPI00301684B7